MDGLIGWLSSSFALAVTQPIDVVKTRYQVSNETVSSIIKDICKTDPSKFYRGFGTNILTYPIFWGVYFYTNSHKFEPTDNKYVNKFLMANISSATASAIANPLFVLKTKKQTEQISYSGLINRIIKKEGVMGFSKGYIATVLNNTKLAIQFPMYDFFKEQQMSTLSASLISKAISTSVYYPLDLIRVNQRNSETKLSISQAFKQAYNFKGHPTPINLYRGVLLYNMISTPNFVLMMIFKEEIEKIIKCGSN